MSSDLRMREKDVAWDGRSESSFVFTIYVRKMVEEEYSRVMDRRVVAFDHKSQLESLFLSSRI